MDVNLDSLIEKVRTEAVEQARQAAAEIAGQAQAEADRLLAEARAEAERIVQRARAEAEHATENGRQALRQAARDAELLLRERLTALFDRVFRRQVGAALTPQALAPIIQQLVVQWAQQGEVTVVVSPADREALEGILLAGLHDELNSGVTVRASQSVTKGFRIERRGSDVYYDFTDETIAETLRAFLSPGLQAMLDGRDG